MSPSLTAAARLARVVALVVASGMAPLIARTGAADAADGGTAYRIVFPHRSFEVPLRGPYGGSNRAAIERIARVLPQWRFNTAVRFQFVARRPRTCTALAGCDASHLMWRRVNTVVTRIKTITFRARTVFDISRIGFAFAEELTPPASLPDEPGDGDTIHLRIMVGKREGGPARCPWRVLLHDPYLPPVLGQSGGSPAIPLIPNAPQMVSQDALFRVVGSNRHATAAFWENGHLEFRKASESVLGNSAQPVPPARQVLHLVKYHESDQAMRRFIDRLTGQFRRPDGVPPSLRRDVAGSKGIGDHVARITPKELVGPAPDSAPTRHCRFVFAPQAERR